jgi:protocatechuate 3,4-dioxygenase beta subunit
VENTKTLLIYLAGILVLALVTVVFSVPEETIDAGNPIATLTARVPSPTSPPPKPAAGCRLTPAVGRQGYRSGAPLTNELTAPPSFQDLEKRLIISGQLLASDCRTPLPNILVEIWHTDPEGRYDRSDNFYLRGQFRTDAKGRYKFATLAPGHYRRGSEWQPVHINFRINHPAISPLYTRLYFSDDPYLKNLPVSAKSLVSKLVEQPGPNGVQWTARFDLALPVLAVDASES